MLLEVEDLVKVYRKQVRANDGISLAIQAGEVFGLLGHNGAGKSTLLGQIAGLLKPTSGRIRVDGHDPVADPAVARRLCSLQPQAQAPLEGISPRRAIETMARVRGAGRRRARERADELLTALDLLSWVDTPGQRLSGGVRRLVAFCMAAAEPGRVVMFDEPTNDVDPVRRKLLWEQVRVLGGSGCAVMLVTHNVVEAERAVQRLVILDKGRVVAQGTPADLRASEASKLRVELVAVDESAAQRLGDRAGHLGHPVVHGRRVTLAINPDASAAALEYAQREHEVGSIEEFAVTPVSLEDVYLRMVGPDSQQRSANDEEDDSASLVP